MIAVIIVGCAATDFRRDSTILRLFKKLLLSEYPLFSDHELTTRSIQFPAHLAEIKTSLCTPARQIKSRFIILKNSTWNFLYNPIPWLVANGPGSFPFMFWQSIQNIYGEGSLRASFMLLDYFNLWIERGWVNTVWDAAPPTSGLDEVVIDAAEGGEGGEGGVDLTFFDSFLSLICELH